VCWRLLATLTPTVLALPVATPSGAADQTTGPLRIRWFKLMLGMFPPGRLIDLGAGHGKFSQVAADAGWTVTALDARGDRYPDDPRITWLIGDVREVDLHGFDVIGCLGLFYHLSIDDQLDLLRRCSGIPIFLDTHVANGRPTPHRLSARVNLKGYVGRLYKEPDQAAVSTAAWGNEASFWPQPRSLYQMLDEHGYDVLTATPWYLPSRTFFLCLPRRSSGLVNHLVGDTGTRNRGRHEELAECVELRAAIDAAKKEAQRQHNRVTAAERRMKESEAPAVRERETLDAVQGSGAGEPVGPPPGPPVQSDVSPPNAAGQ
jgi:hypothetical protein